MKSLNRQVLYTPAASGVWSNTHIDNAPSSPYETGSHYFDTNEILDQSEDSHCDNTARRMIETSLLYANRQSSKLDLNYDTSQNFQFDNYPDRVALPFPNSENADQYKPPHQFYAAKCISQSYAFQKDRSIISEAVPENFESQVSSVRQLDYSACNEDFKLQRPSSFHTSLQSPNSTPYFQLYASVPYLEGNPGEARHIIVPCSFLQPNVLPFSNLVPKSSLELMLNDGKNNASFRENEPYPYSKSYNVSSNSCVPPNSIANNESKTYNRESLYCNLIDTKNFGEEIMRNETSTIYENGQNNEYNYRSEINASINVNHLNQQKTLNSQLHEEKIKSISVS